MMADNSALTDQEGTPQTQSQIESERPCRYRQPNANVKLYKKNSEFSSKQKFTQKPDGLPKKLVSLKALDRTAFDSKNGQL